MGINPPIDLFDCNAMVGMPSSTNRYARNPECVYKARDLISIMDHYGIKCALVSHAICEENGPTPGNEILLSDIKEYDRFYPCWVLLPNHTGELGDLKAFVRRMVETGVRAAKIYPVNHHFSLSEWCIGDLLSELEEYHIPLLMDFNELHYKEEKIQWDKIYEICKNHKNLPVILLRVGCYVNRSLFPLFERFENLHIDISYFQVNDGIEIICEKFGAHHLLFGTGLPVFSPAAPISMLMYSGISMEEKRMVGGENLQRLLESVSM